MRQMNSLCVKCGHRVDDLDGHLDTVRGRCLVLSLRGDKDFVEESWTAGRRRAPRGLGNRGGELVPEEAVQAG